MSASKRSYHSSGRALNVSLRETAVKIKGPAGQIESLIYSADNPHTVAIICHPHPLHEGTMQNKIVFTICRAFQQKGISTVRFNFRGVGESEGEYGDSMGEVDDLMAVNEFVDTQFPEASRYLAGFSFGAYIAAMGATQIPCLQLFSVAPAVTNQPYETLSTITCPWVVLQGEKDEVIPPQAVYDWFEKANNHHSNMELIKIPDATHFFHGHLITLREIIEKNMVQ